MGWVDPWVGLGRDFQFLVGWFESTKAKVLIVKHEDDPPAAKKARVDPFANLRDGASSSTDQSIAVLLSGRDDLARYKAMQVPANYDRALEFWRQHATELLVLSEVARRVYCISASCAQSERGDFSSVGHTITDDRSRLSASKVEATELV